MPKFDHERNDRFSYLPGPSIKEFNWLLVELTLHLHHAEAWRFFMTPSITLSACSEEGFLGFS
jgi:hypothetical protein